MRKYFLSVLILSFVIMPMTTHAGFFDMFRFGQIAQVKSSFMSSGVGSSSYKKGDNSITILEVQTALAKIGFYNGSLSGLLGTKTEEAIKMYQKVNNLSVTGILDQKTIDMILGRGGEDVIENRGGQVTLNVKAFLGGPFNSATNLMNTGLNQSNLIPTTEPYDNLGIYFSDNDYEDLEISPSILDITGENEIVDWVILELRSLSEVDYIGYSRPALIQADGDIVDVDGVSGVQMSVPSGFYYVLVKHRNHLPIMTAEIVNIANPVDMTTLSLYGENPAKIVNGKSLLWPGNTNINNDDEVRYTGYLNDRDPILMAIGGTTPNNIITGYLNTDVNMDGVVKYTGSGNDRDIILQTVGSSTPNNTVIAQLPETVSPMLVQLISADAVVTPGENGFSDLGTFRIKFRITALDDDVYISPSSEMDNGVDTPGQGLAFGVQYAGQDITPNQASISSVTVDITDPSQTFGGNWKIEEGESEIIELTVAVSDVSTNGLFRVYLNSINWANTDNPIDGYYNLNLGPNSDFKTSYIFLNSN